MSLNYTFDLPIDEQPQTPFPETLRMFNKWSLVKSEGDNLPYGIIFDSEVAWALDATYDEVIDQYEGRFTEDFTSDLGILLVLAKKSLGDARFRGFKDDLENLAQEVADMIEETLANPGLRESSSDSDGSTETSFQDNLITMQLALRLGNEVTVIPSAGEEATEVTLNSFPRSASKEHVRLWFSTETEMLSKRFRWSELPRLLENEVWDLSAID